MDKGQHLRIRIGAQSILYPVRINRLAPITLYKNRDRATAQHVLDHAAPEDAIDADDCLVAWLQQVDEHGLHPCGTWSRDGHGQFVAGLEGELQESLDFIHQGDENGVEMPDGGTGKRFQYARINVGWTRP